MSNGIILFKTTAVLVKAEKLLISEGCTITRVPVPLDQPSRLRHRPTLSMVAIRNRQVTT